MCGAATETDDGSVTLEASQDDTVAEINANVDKFTPPLCADGLNLGGLLNFQNPKLIPLKTNGEGTTQADYFGIIGEIK